jgi:hypothetical protein
MTKPLDLPPSVTMGPRSLGVSMVTAQGATVSVLLPKPCGLDEVDHDELVERATTLALAALATATLALTTNDTRPSTVPTPIPSKKSASA